MEDCTLMEGGMEDEQEVLDFLNVHFVPLEPMNAAIGLCEPGYRMPYFDSWISTYLRKPDSLLLLARDRQGLLLGLTVIVTESGCQQEETEDSLPRWRQCPEKMRQVFAFLSVLKDGLDVPGQYGEKKWGDVFMLACNSHRRVPGLGSALITSALATMEERGVKVFTASATSYYSARIFAKRNFTETRSVAYSDYTKEGKQVFPTSEPHTHARQFVRSHTAA